MFLDLDIHNYYEHLVIENISKRQLDMHYDKEFLADLCCLSLSNLPARYIRHEIDMAFYLSSTQRQSMCDEVISAIDDALNYLTRQNGTAKA
ncbi:MAG: late competence development ComFB family protein [Psychrobium sp.]|nr:late competence development ComFB family protein [Psychrobium sp.]